VTRTVLGVTRHWSHGYCTLSSTTLKATASAVAVVLLTTIRLPPSIHDMVRHGKGTAIVHVRHDHHPHLDGQWIVVQSHNDWKALVELRYVSIRKEYYRRE
jgi:hypothetical protein